MINAAGTTVQVWDMPTTGTGKEREYDLDGLLRLIRRLKLMPSVAIGLEWPTTRPGEGSERSERFGRGKGYLEAMLFVLRMEYYKLAPNLWKGRLGIPGKTDPQANTLAAGLFERSYPSYADLIRGPRGGIKDGRCDALLMAHFLRARGVGYMHNVLEKHGWDSPEAAAILFGPKRNTRRKKGGILP